MWQSPLRLVAFGVVVGFGVCSHAVTLTFNRNINTDTENRPFFDPAAFPTFPNPAGYAGTATPGEDTVSIVTGPTIGSGFGTSRLADLSDGNGVPYGVRFRLVEPSFAIEAINGVLESPGNDGLGIDSSNGGANTDTHLTRLSGSTAAGGAAGADVDEQVRFGPVQFSSILIDDPLGRLQPGTVVDTAWRVIRGRFFGANNGAIVSSDDAGTMDVTLFGVEDPNGVNTFGNNFSTGTFTPVATAYITTTRGDWALKGIGFEVTIDFEANAAPPNRRIFDFANAGTMGETTRTITEDGLDVTLTPVGQSALLGYNNNGVGVISFGDPDGTGTNADLRIEGATGAASAGGFRNTPESLQLSFNQDVVFESMLLGNVSGEGAEPVILSFVSGTNPFSGLNGYDSDGFSTDGNSITFTRSEGGGELFLAYGIDGRDSILVEAGTVLALTSNPSVEGGVLLGALSANLIPDGLPGDLNGDGVVDAADYVWWRKTNGSLSEYQDWRADFGTTSLGGGGALAAASAVPEPTGMAAAGVALLVLISSVRRRGAAGQRR